MIHRLIAYLCLSLGLTFLTAASLGAASDNLILDEVLQIKVLPGWRTQGSTHMAAFHIQLKPGWKTYWRAPGEGGIPPQFDWSGSGNIKAVQLHWPRPKVSFPNGLRTIGYTDEVVIPVEFTPRKPGQAMTLKGRVDLGVCNEICIPLSLEFSARLPADGTKPDKVIRTALAKRPTPAHKAGVSSVTCAIEPISDGLRLTATINMPSTGAGEITVIETGDQGVWIAQASTKRKGRILTAVTELVPPSNAPFMLDRSKIRITVMGSKRAVDIRGCTG